MQNYNEILEALPISKPNENNNVKINVNEHPYTSLLKAILAKVERMDLNELVDTKNNTNNQNNESVASPASSENAVTMFRMGDSFSEDDDNPYESSGSEESDDDIDDTDVDPDTNVDNLSLKDLKELVKKLMIGTIHQFFSESRAACRMNWVTTNQDGSYNLPYDKNKLQRYYGVMEGAYSLLCSNLKIFGDINDYFRIDPIIVKLENIKFPPLNNYLNLQMKFLDIYNCDFAVNLLPSSSFTGSKLKRVSFAKDSSVNMSAFINIERYEDVFFKGEIIFDPIINNNDKARAESFLELFKMALTCSSWLRRQFEDLQGLYDNVNKMEKMISDCNYSIKSIENQVKNLLEEQPTGYLEEVSKLKTKMEGFESAKDYNLKLKNTCKNLIIQHLSENCPFLFITKKIIEFLCTSRLYGMLVDENTDNTMQEILLCPELHLVHHIYTLIAEEPFGLFMRGEIHAIALSGKETQCDELQPQSKELGETKQQLDAPKSEENEDNKVESFTFK